MANIFLVSHILLLFHSPKGLWNKSAKYEKLGKYWPYCTRNCSITNAYVYCNCLLTRLFVQLNLSYQAIIILCVCVCVCVYVCVCMCVCVCVCSFKLLKTNVRFSVVPVLNVYEYVWTIYKYVKNTLTKLN